MIASSDVISMTKELAMLEIITLLNKIHNFKTPTYFLKVWTTYQCSKCYKQICFNTISQSTECDIIIWDGSKPLNYSYSENMPALNDLYEKCIA